MRIVIVASNLSYGGAETQIIALSRKLVQRGHAVAIYTLNRNNPRTHELDGSGVEVVVDQKRTPFDLSVVLRLRRFLRRFQADIVHGFLFDGDFYSRLAAVGTRVPALNSERSDNYELNSRQRLGHALTRRLVAGVVANTHAGARFAQTMFGLPARHVHVVWNGINLESIDARIAGGRIDVRNEFFGGADVRVACLVGNIKPAKDYILALRTASRLTADHSDWRVLFVGDKLDGGGNYKAAVMCEWERANLGDRVVFAGLRRDVVEIVGQCDALFSTSLHEGFPNVVLEAMAARTPVVSTEYSDIRKILPFTWQIVPDREPSAFADAILRSSRECGETRVAQRAWVEQNATIEISAERLEDVYRLYVPGSSNTGRMVPELPKR